MEIHDLVSRLKTLAIELGGNPTMEQFIDYVGTSRHHLNTKYGGWAKVLAAAGMESDPRNRKKFQELNGITPAKPKILYIDIETAPIEARVWGRWEQNIAMNQVTRDWFIMSFAADLDGVMHQLDQRFSNPINDDSMLLTAIHHLLCQADIVYTWNGDRFDFKKINARFLANKMTPPSQYRSIDGLKVVKNKFALTSNKLDDVAKLFGLDGKLHSEKFPGQILWNECLAGNMEAWEDMAAYNIQDVKVLIEVMKRLDPWHSKVNFSVFEHENICSCGSKNIMENGININNAGKFQAFICGDCGKHFQGKANLLHPETRKELLK